MNSVTKRDIQIFLIELVFERSDFEKVFMDGWKKQ